MPGDAANARPRILDTFTPAQRAHVERRLAELTERAFAATVDADRVLAVVDAATGNRCACGCGVAITDSSPSAYYASAGCQHRWMARNVDRPEEVYEADDAALVYGDDVPSPLTAPGRRNPLLFSPGVAPVPGRPSYRHSRTLIHGPGRHPAEVAYRRRCDACDDLTEPNVFDVDPEDVTRFGRGANNRVVRSLSQWEQECSRCGAANLGTVYVPHAVRQADPATWVLDLHSRYGRVRTTVSDLARARRTDDAAYIADTWAAMERDLARFEREWRGRQAGPPDLVAATSGQAYLADPAGYGWIPLGFVTDDGLFRVTDAGA